jgi:hypothetical protein
MHERHRRLANLAQHDMDRYPRINRDERSPQQKDDSNITPMALQSLLEYGLHTVLTEQVLQTLLRRSSQVSPLVGCAKPT